MDWKGILGLTVAALIVGLALGLVVGMRGCGGSTSKLLQENAELKAEVTRHKFLADEAERLRAKHAERRNTAERELAAMEEQQAASEGTIKDLRVKVAKVNRKRDERNDLIDAYESQAQVKDNQNDLLQAALSAAKDTMDAEFTAHSHTKSALATNEERADKLEKHVMKERPKKILIGVGSAIGGAGVMALAVYGAGRL